MSMRRVVAVAIAAAFSLAAAGAQEVLPVDAISNWAAPPYWTPLKAVAVEKDGEDQPGTQPQAVAGVPTSALAFTGITPCRIADTRSGSGFTGQYGPPQITPAGRTITIAGQCGIPGNAEAVSFNFHAVNVTAAGFFVAYPAGGAFPPVAIMAYNQNTPNISNSAVVPLGTGGAITVVAGVTNIDLIIDTNGYYAPQTVVNTVNGLSGAVTLAAGTNISVTPAGNTLTIAAPNVDATTLGGQPASFYDQAPPPPSGNTITPLDTAGDVGLSTSVTIGADGLGLISYNDATNGDLKVAHCSNVGCTSATITPLDTAGSVGFDTSVTIGADGLGLISYFDQTNGDLKVAHCSNVNCTAATITPLDTAGIVGTYTSVTIGADGLGLISYYDNTNANLKVAHCSNLNCTTATITPLDTLFVVGDFTSVTIGADGLGLISYRYGDDFALKVAHCSSVNCTSATITVLDSGNVGLYTSVTIGADGLGLISYRDGTNADLKVAHCSNLNCTSATITPLDTAGFVGRYTSVTIGADGLGLISYLDDTNADLKVAHCSNVNCTSATITPLDTAGFVGSDTSVTIGADGLGLISYRDNSNAALKVAHCSNALCAPYFRRR